MLRQENKSRQETQRRVGFGGRSEIASTEKAVLTEIALTLGLVLIVRLSLKHSVIIIAYLIIL